MFGSLIVERLVPKKAYFPIEVTLEGKITPVKLPLERKPEAPMLVTPLGITAVPEHEEAETTTLLVIWNEPPAEQDLGPSDKALLGDTGPRLESKMIALNVTRNFFSTIY